jgi:hypothetical protein
MSNQGDKIYIKDFTILFETDRLLDFIPTDKMSYNEKVNAIMRFSIYITFILCLIKADYVYLYILLIALVLTYLAHIFKGDKESFTDSECIEEEEETKESNCQKPTSDNPFMNALITDDFKEKKKACTYSDNVNKTIDKLFNKEIFMDTSQIFNKKGNQRQFYSTPCTTIPNDQEAFRNWLYKTPEVCATGNEASLEASRSCSYMEVPLSN